MDRISASQGCVCRYEGPVRIEFRGEYGVDGHIHSRSLFQESVPEFQIAASGQHEGKDEHRCRLEMSHGRFPLESDVEADVVYPVVRILVVITVGVPFRVYVQFL